jgi:OmpA-OmpF porin, OOP family
MKPTFHRAARLAVLAGIAAVWASSPWAQAAPGAKTAATAPEATRTVTRSTAIPAKGLFQGDQLSESARQRLTELIIEALGLDIEVALVVPSGPWQIDGSGDAERRLTPARLESVRRFLAQRGVDPKRIYVESRVDAQLSEPRLVIELVGRPGRD